MRITIKNLPRFVNRSIVVICSTDLQGTCEACCEESLEIAYRVWTIWEQLMLFRIVLFYLHANQMGPLGSPPVGRALLDNQWALGLPKFMNFCLDLKILLALSIMGAPFWVRAILATNFSGLAVPSVPVAPTCDALLCLRVCMCG